MSDRDDPLGCARRSLYSEDYAGDTAAHDDEIREGALVRAFGEWLGRVCDSFGRADRRAGRRLRHRPLLPRAAAVFGGWSASTYRGRCSSARRIRSARRRSRPDVRWSRRFPRARVRAAAIRSGVFGRRARGAFAVRRGGRRARAPLAAPGRPVRVHRRASALVLGSAHDEAAGRPKRVRRRCRRRRSRRALRDRLMRDGLYADEERLRDVLGASAFASSRSSYESDVHLHSMAVARTAEPRGRAVRGTPCRCARRPRVHRREPVAPARALRRVVHDRHARPRAARGGRGRRWKRRGVRVVGRRSAGCERDARGRGRSGGGVQHERASGAVRSMEDPFDGSRRELPRQPGAARGAARRESRREAGVSRDRGCSTARADVDAGRRDAYARSAVHSRRAQDRGREYLTIYGRLYGLRSTVVRITNPYGPGQPARPHAYGVVNRLIHLALARSSRCRFTATAASCATTCTSTMRCDALLAAGASPRRPTAASTTSAAAPARALVDMAQRDLDPPAAGRLGSCRGRRSPSRSRPATSSPTCRGCRRETGWAPATPLADGLRRTVAYYVRTRAVMRRRAARRLYLSHAFMVGGAEEMVLKLVRHLPRTGSSRRCARSTSRADWPRDRGDRRAVPTLGRVPGARDPCRGRPIINTFVRRGPISCTRFC